MLPKRKWCRSVRLSPNRRQRYSLSRPTFLWVYDAPVGGAHKRPCPCLAPQRTLLECAPAARGNQKQGSHRQEDVCHGGGTSAPIGRSKLYRWGMFGIRVAGYHSNDRPKKYAFSVNVLAPFDACKINGF